MTLELVQVSDLRVRAGVLDGTDGIDGMGGIDGTDGMDEMDGSNGIDGMGAIDHHAFEVHDASRC